MSLGFVYLLDDKSPCLYSFFLLNIKKCYFRLKNFNTVDVKIDVKLRFYKRCRQNKNRSTLSVKRFCLEEPNGLDATDFFFMVFI